MIYPTTKIQWLDFKEQLPFEESIQEMFQKYSHMFYRMKDNDYNLDTILFDQFIKVKDLTGWTDLISIKRIEKTKGVKWFNLRAMGSYENIIVSEDELIPIYIINDHMVGFHGEVKYSYILMNPEKIPLDDNHKLRMHELTHLDLDFIPLSISHYSCTNINYGYELITKSRFFNGNNIHLYGSDEISFDDVEKWYK